MIFSQILLAQMINQKGKISEIWNNHQTNPIRKLINLPDCNGVKSQSSKNIHSSTEEIPLGCPIRLNNDVDMLLE